MHGQQNITRVLSLVDCDISSILTLMKVIIFTFKVNMLVVLKICLLTCLVSAGSDRKYRWESRHVSQVSRILCHCGTRRSTGIDRGVSTRQTACSLFGETLTDIIF